MPRRGQHVRPGEWIQVTVNNDEWPITMEIGGSPPQAAFIDHQRSGDSVRTVVQRRCPQLDQGVYAVIVRTPTQTLRTSIRVV